MNGNTGGEPVRVGYRPTPTLSTLYVWVKGRPSPPVTGGAYQLCGVNQDNKPDYHGGVRQSGAGVTCVSQGWVSSLILQGGGGGGGCHTPPDSS